MDKSEQITSHHLARKAVIYIRQSTPHQQISNQESVRLQYALKQRAINLGWKEKDIEIIDSDLGLSGSGIQHREGFKEMLTKVTLGEVGIILSYEVTRLSRNCSDFYPLLDLCGYRGCLIGDAEAIYDPATPNGRILLGLKGQLSELELHMIRTRLTAGLLNKAMRGELALTLPVGLVRDNQGNVHKDPNLEVKRRLELIFDTFLELRSASKVLRFFNENQLLIPRQDSYGDIIWKKPNVAAIISTLKNPAYAGAFAYGKTRTMRRREDPSQITQKHLPIQEWKILVKDKFPQYISWETYEKIQAQLADNYAEYERNKSRGVPREGKTMLHGIVYCGECGHKMVVRYHPYSRYLCTYLRQQYGVPVCQFISADPVDEVVIKAFFEALSSIEIDVYNTALEERRKSSQQVLDAHRQQIQRLEYQAGLAQRQYDKADPDNRLVTAELEKRWENALWELKKAKEAFAQLQQKQEVIPTISPDLKEIFSNIGQRLPEIWDSPILENSKKKAMLRCLIDKVVIHRITSDQVQVRIVWKGGSNSTCQIPIYVCSFAELSNAQEMEKIILELHDQGKSDEHIADQLNLKGFRSPRTDHLLVSTVKAIRLKHHKFILRSQSHPRKITGCLTLPQIALALDVKPHWIYHLINTGRIKIIKDPETGLYLFPDEPSTLSLFRKLKDGEIDHLHFQK